MAFVISLTVAAILSVWVVLEIDWHLENRYDPRYFIHLEEGIIRLFFCFVLWTKSFKALWPRSPLQSSLRKHPHTWVSNHLVDELIQPLDSPAEVS